MRYDNPFEIRKLKAEFPDIIDQLGDVVQATGVQQDQAFSGVNQMRAAPGVSHKIQISINPERFLRQQIRAFHNLIRREHISETIKIPQFSHTSRKIVILLYIKPAF